LTQLLAEILKKPEASRVIRSGLIVLLWEESISQEIAKQTEAVKVKNRILYVNAKSPVWAQELNFLKKEIMDRINEKAGFMAVKDIRFKAGG
jgi:predicted nucleic acid-binding Zn ribbon protein